MRPPDFWARPGGLAPLLLAPIGGVVASMAAQRAARQGWRAPVPVLCCGNVTMGGAGKTTLALDVGRRLLARGVAVHFLTRGYRGMAKGIRRVDPDRHGAALVGDEPLLLAAVAPCWVGADRAASAQAAVAAGAAALVMDDGLQNPLLEKDCSLLVIDGGSGFGNGRVLPAGPLREPVLAGAARCRTAVLIGPDVTGARAALPADLPVLRADLIPESDLTGLRVLAFAGIGRPEKFFASAEQAGATLLGRRSFSDHHSYPRRTLDELLDQAEKIGAVPLTTAKDAARLPPDLRRRVRVLGIALAWDRPDAIDALLREVVP